MGSLSSLWHRPLGSLWHPEARPPPIQRLLLPLPRARGLFPSCFLCPGASALRFPCLLARSGQHQRLWGAHFCMKGLGRERLTTPRKSFARQKRMTRRGVRPSKSACCLVRSLARLLACCWLCCCCCGQHVVINRRAGAGVCVCVRVVAKRAGEGAKSKVPRPTDVATDAQRHVLPAAIRHIWREHFHRRRVWNDGGAWVVRGVVASATCKWEKDKCASAQATPANTPGAH